jgi:hypothetical protein
MVFTIFCCLFEFLQRKSKMKFLLASMKSLNNCEIPSSNPLQGACSGFLIAACALKVVTKPACDSDSDTYPVIPFQNMQKWIPEPYRTVRTSIWLNQDQGFSLNLNPRTKIKLKVNSKPFQIIGLKRLIFYH